MIPSRSWLRIVTFNTWKGEGRYHQRMENMILQLSELRPDVICLQESLQSEDGNFDTAAVVANRLGMVSVYAPGRKKTRSIEGTSVLCSSGLAVVSRHPLSTHTVRLLPTAKEDPERFAQQVRIQTDCGRQVSVTNLHLTHIGQADDIRLEQLIAAASEHLHAHDALVPALVCGDLNLALNNDHLHLFQSKLNLRATDCYLAGRGKRPGHTCPAGSPGNGRRLDYILALSQTNGTIPVCANSRIVLNQPDASGDYPSDHYGVMADLFLGEL